MFPVLIALFVASGAAALIYEIVWFQLLQFVIGSSAVSLAVLLTTFMGGMCLGSLLFPRIISNDRHPLKIYAAIEGGIGALAILVLLIVPLITTPYAAYVGHGFAGILVRGVVAGICLVPPTILMGATLPAISRWVAATPGGMSSLGFFYGGNIAGGVIGCLLAGFYLLRLYDVTIATTSGVVLNAIVAAVALLLARHPIPSPHASTDAPAAAADVAWTIYLVTALSGMTALAAEVIWTRLLSLVLGATVYAFSIILATFLVGLGIGSGVGTALAKRFAHPRFALGICQWLIAIGCAWAAWMMSAVLPYWPVNPSLAQSPWLVFQVDVTRSVWALLPPTLFWGASFPLALAALTSSAREADRLVGGLYAANTLGAIVGAAGASLVTIQAWGTQGSERALIVAAAVAGTLALGPSLTSTVAQHGSRRAGLGWLAGFAAAVCVVGWLILRLPAVPGLLIAYGRFMVTWTDPTSVIYTGEGLNASIAVTQTPNGVRNFHVSGKIEASSQSNDMRLQRMLAHIPALTHPDPKSVLVIGFGAGVTAGSFVPYPEVGRILIAEIEPLIPRAIAPYFSRQNDDVLRDPRVSLVYDDARHYVLTTDERFDVITSDPIHPWVKGSAALYTQEYFELLKRHLKSGGMVTQWIPLYESDLDVVKSEIATFLAVFPDATIWANLQNEQGYDLVALGRAASGPIDLNFARARFDDPAHAKAAASLNDVGLSPRDLFATYAGRGADLRTWVQGAPINRDRNLRLQYLAGLQANRYDSDAIYADMVRYRRYPEGLFVGSEDLVADLRRRITNPGQP